MMKYEIAITAFTQWWNGLKIYKGFQAMGTIGGALVVLQRLQANYTLDIEDHTAKGGAQVAGAGDAAKRILEHLGEKRPFPSQAGRTNRGLRGDMKSMLDALRTAELDELSSQERTLILIDLQRFLVAKVGEFHARQRLKIPYDHTKSTRQTIQDLLKTAHQTNRDGPVAQYLVGAKLQRRFPDRLISNESSSTADKQLDRDGDFTIETTVFHVTVSPQPHVYLKCKNNLDNNLRPYLLVPDNAVIGARQNAEATAPGQIAVEFIESFIAQNVDELATFSRKKLLREFRLLLETYNERVEATEVDKSMMIEIPKSLYQDNDY